MFDCHVQIIRCAKCNAQIMVCFGVSGVDVNGLTIVGDGLADVTQC